MYIKKAIREEINRILDLIGKEQPELWDKFIENEKEYLIFKNKNEYKCGCCNSVFESNIKINDYEICPNCNKKMLVKRYDIQNYNSKKDLFLLKKFNNEYLILVYELWSYLSNKKMEHSTVLWQVITLNENMYVKQRFTTNAYKNYMGVASISHFEKLTSLKPFYWNTSLFGKYYPYNLNEIFNYKYYDFESLALNSNIDLQKIEFGAVKKSRLLEMLIKAKLYNLASYCYELEEVLSGTNPKTFKQAFGVDISYLKFMQENNITYYELKMLSKLGIKDIKIIRYFVNLNHKTDLDKLLKICKVNDLYKYNLNDYKIYLYVDYLRFAKELGLDLTNKKYLYPKNLKAKHDELMELIKFKKDEKIRKAMLKRYKNLSKNIYEDNRYIIYPVKTLEELNDESNQQNNCVKTYAERYAKGETDLYFLRLVKDKNKSLVTVEVTNNKIVQSRIKNNQLPNKKEMNFLKKWEKEVLNTI